MGHPAPVDDALDLDAVRLLSAWLSARNDLTAHLDLLTSFGPCAADQVARNLVLIDGLQAKDAQRWEAYRSHLLRSSPGPRED